MGAGCRTSTRLVSARCFSRLIGLDSLSTSGAGIFRKLGRLLFVLPVMPLSDWIGNRKDSEQGSVSGYSEWKYSEWKPEREIFPSEIGGT